MVMAEVSRRTGFSEAEVGWVVGSFWSGLTGVVGLFPIVKVLKFLIIQPYYWKVGVQIGDIRERHNKEGLAGYYELELLYAEYLKLKVYEAALFAKNTEKIRAWVSGGQMELEGYYDEI